MAREKKPYDLQCWMDLVNKGQWFMVWEQNWVPLFTWRPAMILKWPMERLDAVHWHAAVVKRPELADHCDFASFSASEWVTLLGSKPAFASKCNWDLLGGDDWVSLLGSQPKFAKYCDWDKLTPDEWVRLFVLRPELGKYCKIWDQFSFHNWQGIIAYHGDYAWRCPERMRKGIDSRAWFWEAADAWHENEELQIARRNEGKTPKGGGCYT